MNRWLTHLALLQVLLFVLGCEFEQPAFPRGAYPLLPAPDVEQRVARVACSVPLEGKRTSLSELMAAHRIPGVSVAAMEGGRIVWARAFGYADVAKNRPMTPETILQAASISKPMTAVAVLRMVQARELSLDADVTDLVDWEPDGRDARISLRQILSHTSGLSVHGFKGYKRNKDDLPSALEVLEGKGNSPKVRLAGPQGQYDYSGGGFTLMQALVEDEIEDPFEEAMYDWLIRPFRLTRSTFEQPLTRERAGWAATAYVDGAPVPFGHHVYPEKAAAGLWTTPTDLLTVAAALVAAYQGAPGPLSSALVREMFSPAGPGQKFGLGFGVRRLGDVVELSHGGVNHGFSASLVFRTDGYGAAVMVNGNGPVSGAVLASVAEEYGWRGKKPANACP
jgi:CubicO group peptidase (beta-lactamase class C family)